MERRLEKSPSKMKLKSRAVTSQHHAHRKARHPTTTTLDVCAHGKLFRVETPHAVSLQEHGVEPTLRTQALEPGRAIHSSKNTHSQPRKSETYTESRVGQRRQLLDLRPQR